jgi:DNA-binding transcriptional MocR family regulator
MAILDALAGDIAAGRLKAGDRLPTQRDLADCLGVSLGTVTRAYSAAERRGLIRGETGRGTFVAGAPVDLYGAAEFELTTAGMIDMAVVRPLYGFDPDMAPALREVARRPERAELLHYQPNAGMRRHREAGAAWAARHGLAAEADQVIVCAGIQHALTVALVTVCRPGDVLLVEALTYPGVRVLAGLLELKLVPVPMDAHGLIPEALDSACRQHQARALFTMPSIHNPTTITLSEERRRRIAGIAAEHGLAVLEDAVNHLLLDDPPPPLSAFMPGSGYFMAGLAKAAAGGLRVAFLIAPPSMIEPLNRSVWATTWMTAPLCAEVAAVWIEDGTVEAALRRKRAEARERVSLARKILAGFDLRTETCSHHAWLSLPEGWESAARFAGEARRQRVAVAPADLFDPTGGAPAAVRIALSTPPTRQLLEEGLERLKQVLSNPAGLGTAIV